MTLRRPPVRAMRTPSPGTGTDTLGCNLLTVRNQRRTSVVSFTIEHPVEGKNGTMRYSATRAAATLAVIGLSALVGVANPAFACAGLIGSNGAVNLGRTTT